MVNCTPIFTACGLSHGSSFVGSLFIIIMYFCNKELQRFSFKLVVYLSVVDLGWCVADLLMTTGVSSNPTGLACVTVGFTITYFYLSSCCWTLVISWCLYARTMKGSLKDNREMHYSERNYRLFAFGLPLLIALM